MQAERVALEQQEVSFDAIAASVVANVAHWAREKGWRWSSSGGAAGTPVRRPRRLQQALTNYVTNAIKFTKAEITVRAQVDSERRQRAGPSRFKTRA
jgi:signal transduction histidine kinase